MISKKILQLTMCMIFLVSICCVSVKLYQKADPVNVIHSQGKVVIIDAGHGGLINTMFY